MMVEIAPDNPLFDKVLVLLTGARAPLFAARSSFRLARQGESFLKRAVKASSGNLQGFVEVARPALKITVQKIDAYRARRSTIKRHYDKRRIGALGRRSSPFANMRESGCPAQVAKRALLRRPIKIRIDHLA